MINMKTKMRATSFRRCGRGEHLDTVLQVRPSAHRLGSEAGSCPHLSPLITFSILNIFMLTQWGGALLF